MEQGSTTAPGEAHTRRDAAAAIAENPLWYHTIEVAPGVVTPGWFDLRPTVAKLPWPDVEGKRCLDVGTADGFLAFELERRGAAEVLATDLADHELWDWPLRTRALGVEYLREIAGPDKNLGLEIARRLRGSSVDTRQVSAYDISPETVGEFDVVVCGSLLLHLRDPLRALEAIRSVCRGPLLCINQVDLSTSVAHPRKPLARIDGLGRSQWWIPNVAGHRQLLLAGGFDIDAETGLYSIPFGPAHRPLAGSRLRAAAGSLARRVFTGNDGVVSHAALARPAV